MNHLLLNQIHEIETNPETTGTKLTVIHLFASIIIGILNDSRIIKDGHINPLIMETLQSVAWIMTIAIGAITFFGYVKKWFSKKKGSDNKDKNRKP